MRWPLLLAAFSLGLLPSPARVTAADPPFQAENVIVVTLDGFRHQEFFGGADSSLISKKAGGVRDEEVLKRRFWRGSTEARREALLPFIWGTVARSGQIFGDRSRNAPARLTNGMKFSYPGYSEIFCGFGDPRVDSNDNKPNPNPSVFEFLNARETFRGRVAIFGTWDVYQGIFRIQQNGLKAQLAWDPIADEPLSDRQRLLNQMIDRLPRLWKDNVYDAITTEAALEHLVRHKPRVLYIALGETDEWAHGRRYDLYLESANQADRFLAELWRTVQELPQYRGKTALIVTTDHGRGSTPDDWTDHGREVPDAEDIWIALTGPGIPASGIREGIESTQSQVAGTIARLLGEDFQAFSPRSAPPLPGIGPQLK